MKKITKISAIIGALAATPALAVDVVPYTNQTVSSIILNIIDWTFKFAGAVAVLFIIYAGLMMASSGGNKDRLEKAKKTLTYAVLGIIVVILSQAIVSFINFNINATL